MTSPKNSEYYNVAGFLPKLNVKKEEYSMFQDVSILKNIIHIWYVYKYELSNIILTNKLQFLVDVVLNTNMKTHKALINSGKQYEWSDEFESFYSKKYTQIIDHISEIRTQIELNNARIDEGFKIILELESCFDDDIQSDKLNYWFKKFTNLMIYDYKYTVLHIDEETLAEEIEFIKFSESGANAWNYNLLLFETNSWYTDFLEMFSTVDPEIPEKSAINFDMERDLLNQLKELLSSYLSKNCEYSLSILNALNKVIELSKEVSSGGVHQKEQIHAYDQAKHDILTKIYNFSYIYISDGNQQKVSIENKFTTLLKFGYTCLTSNKCYEMNMLNKANIYDKGILHEKLLNDLMYSNNCPSCKYFNLFAPVNIDKPFKYTHISRHVNLNISGLSNMNFVFLDNTDVIGASSVVVERDSYSKLSSVFKQIFDIHIGDFIIPDRVNHIPASKDPISLNYFIERNSILKQLWNIIDPLSNETDMFLSLPYGPENSKGDTDYKKPTFEDSCQFVKNMIEVFINEKITQMGFPAFMNDNDLQKNKVKYLANKEEYLHLAEFTFTKSSTFYRKTEAFLL